MTHEEVNELLERVADGDEAATQELFRILVHQDPATQVLFLEAIQNASDAELWDQLVLTLAEVSPTATVSPPRHASPGPVGPEPAARPVASRETRELIEALSSPRRQVRVQAAQALGEQREAAAVAPLVRALGDERPVAGAAQRALEMIGADAVPALVEALGHQVDQVRWYAARALATIQDPRAIPAQIVALNDPNYGVRWLAAEGLVAEGAPALRALLEALTERKLTSWFRLSASHVLNRVPYPNPDIRSELRAAADQIKRGPAAEIPILARALLARIAETR